MTTPHLPKIDYNQVYEPSEDSFLLMDALEMEHSFIQQLNPTFVCEIGSGSGILINFIQQFQFNSLYIATDINPVATLATLETAKLNKCQTEVIRTQFIQGWRVKMDIILFNPPYVVTPPEEVGRQDITAAWAGGIDGRQVIDQFLLNLSSMLSTQGYCYLLVINENKPDEIIKFANKLGFDCSKVIYRKCGYEGQTILKLCYS